VSEFVIALVVAGLVLGALGRMWWLHGDPPAGAVRRPEPPRPPVQRAPIPNDYLSLALDQLERERQAWLRAALWQEEARRLMYDAVRRSRS